MRGSWIESPPESGVSSESHAGVGLGLYFCRLAIEGMAGELRLTSEPGLTVFQIGLSRSRRARRKRRQPSDGEKRQAATCARAPPVGSASGGGWRAAAVGRHRRASRRPGDAA